MHIKRFRAPSSKEAIEKVKKEFGPDALIVQNRRLAGGLTEVIAALDREDMGGDPLPAGSMTGSETQRILEEMMEIKDLLAAMAGSSETGGKALSTLKRQLMANGLDSVTTLKLLAEARDRGAEKGDGRDIAYLKDIVRDRLGTKIMVKDPMRESRVISFIGPTGAGKTTTIAKLAAITALKKTKKVALLTLDTRRIGAPQQLVKYGRMIGVPVGVAALKEEVSAFLEKYSRCRFIFIDTPGSGTGERGYIRELQELSSISPEVRFNLVLSVRDRDESLYETVKGFSTLPVDAITFTKLDECRSFGQMLGISMRAKRPISYLGTGQKVPGDLMPATVKGLLKYLMPA